MEHAWDDNTQVGLSGKAEVSVISFFAPQFHNLVFLSGYCFFYHDMDKKMGIQV